jgi:hypothetical protein
MSYPLKDQTKPIKIYVTDSGCRRRWIAGAITAMVISWALPGPFFLLDDLPKHNPICEAASFIC